MAQKKKTKSAKAKTAKKAPAKKATKSKEIKYVYDFGKKTDGDAKQLSCLVAKGQTWLKWQGLDCQCLLGLP